MEIKKAADTSRVEVEGSHKHKLVYLGALKAEGTSTGFPLYQCRECGTTFEMFENGKYAAMYPEWTVDKVRAAKESIEFVKREFTTKAPASRVLGRGLIELQASQPQSSKGFDMLVGKDKK